MSEAARPKRWPHLAGRLDEGVHTLPVRIYYEDTDFSGVVYHASYLRFMERGRSDFLRLAGVHHAELRDGALGEPLFFAVARMEIEFRRPARIDDILEVSTWVTGVGGASFALAQSVAREGETLIEAKVRAAVVNAEGRPHRLSAESRARFEEFRAAAAAAG